MCSAGRRACPPARPAPAAVPARRLELAAVLAQLRRDVGHAEQLVDLLLVGAGVASRRSRRRRRRTRSRAGRACTASVAQRLVVASGAGEVLQQVAEALRSGTMRRSTGTPLWVTTAAPARPRRCTSSTAAARRTPPPARAGSLAAATMSRSLHGLGQRRALPASSTRSPAGCARSASTSSLADSQRLRRAGARPCPAVGARRERGQHVLLGLRPEARHVPAGGPPRGGAQVVERRRCRAAS